MIGKRNVVTMIGFSLVTIISIVYIFWHHVKTYHWWWWWKVLEFSLLPKLSHSCGLCSSHKNKCTWTKAQTRNRKHANILFYNEITNEPFHLGHSNLYHWVSTRLGFTLASCSGARFRCWYWEYLWSYSMVQFPVLYSSTRCPADASSCCARSLPRTIWL